MDEMTPERKEQLNKAFSKVNQFVCKDLGVGLKLPVEDMLAVAAYLTGQLLAQVPLPRLSHEDAIELVNDNITKGNQDMAHYIAEQMLLRRGRII